MIPSSLDCDDDLRFAQFVDTSVNVITNSPSQDYTHPDDHNLSTYKILVVIQMFYMYQPLKQKKNLCLTAIRSLVGTIAAIGDTNDIFAISSLLTLSPAREKVAYSRHSLTPSYIS